MKHKSRREEFIDRLNNEVFQEIVKKRMLKGRDNLCLQTRPTRVKVYEDSNTVDFPLMTSSDGEVLYDLEYERNKFIRDNNFYIANILKMGDQFSILSDASGHLPFELEGGKAVFQVLEKIGSGYKSYDEVVTNFGCLFYIEDMNLWREIVDSIPESNRSSRYQHLYDRNMNPWFFLLAERSEGNNSIFYIDESEYGIDSDPRVRYLAEYLGSQTHYGERGMVLCRVSKCFSVVHPEEDIVHGLYLPIKFKRTTKQTGVMKCSREENAFQLNSVSAEIFSNSEHMKEYFRRRYKEVFEAAEEIYTMHRNEGSLDRDFLSYYYPENIIDDIEILKSDSKAFDELFNIQITR